MMRVLGKVVLAVGVAALLGSPVWAQGFRGGGMGGSMLLQNASVQKELKLSDDQKDKIKTITKEFREKNKDELAKLFTPDLDQKERQEIGQKLNHEAMKLLTPVLTDDQRKRFHQLELQVSGAQAFSDPKVQKALKLTDDQKDKIKTIEEDARKEVQEIFQNAGEDRAAAMKKLGALRKETLEKVTTVLTDEQKKSWKDMTGKPFEFKFDGPPRRPRPNG
ncbi:MAG TPA: hypothetical protein VG013_16325 [Gemmataceae bacterium]|jgi:Spy/CpxP family protein refolding chaperone|nr:hypothetical protein [Gemmataceae bacterium]